VRASSKLHDKLIKLLFCIG